MADKKKTDNTATKTVKKSTGLLGGAARALGARQRQIDGYVDATVNGNEHKAKSKR